MVLWPPTRRPNRAPRNCKTLEAVDHAYGERVDHEIIASAQIGALAVVQQERVARRGRSLRPDHGVVAIVERGEQYSVDSETLLEIQNSTPPPTW